MKDGYKVWDSDTHVEPSAEVIDKYLDPGFRNRLPELAQFRTPIAATTPGSSPGRHVYRFGQISFKRILGEAEPRPGAYRPRLGMDGHSEAAPRGAGRRGGKPHRRHGRRGGRCAFPDPDRVDQPGRARGPVARNQRDPRLPPAHGGFLLQSSRPADQHDRRLGPRRRRRGQGNPRLGQVEMGGGGDAARDQGHPGRSSRPRADLAGLRRARPADLPSQLYLDAALFSRRRSICGTTFFSGGSPRTRGGRCGSSPR